MANEIKAILFISFNIVIFADNSNILNNPIKTDIKTNPLDFYISFNSCGDKTLDPLGKTNEVITIIQENNQVKFNGKSYTYSPNIFLCINDTNNPFLFAEYNLYKITKDFNNNITSASIYKSIPNDYKYFGYLIHNFDGDRKHEIILYGINESTIFFYYIEKQSEYKFSFSHKINTVSCKYLDHSNYLCAFDQDNEIYIIIFAKKDEQLLVKHGPEILVNSTLYHDRVFLYDTNINTNTGNFRYKILCAANIENYFVSCNIMKYKTFQGEGGIESYNPNFQFQNLSCQPNYIINEEKCYMTTFMSEFLLCCGMKDKIECQRKNETFGTINEFQINLPGDIKNLTMVTNNTNYVKLSYFNETSDEKFVYDYYIYPPICQNISKNITAFNEIEFILFEKKTNTQYNITFNNLPFEYGTSKLNGIELNNLNKEIEIKDNIANFTFISNNSNITDNFDITYNIFIKETYSTECKISFSIMSCYKSCKNCTLYEDQSNQTNHNCIECNEKEGYYHILDLESSNCYTEQEMSILHPNYYLDRENNVFALCNSSCQTCNGLTDENCLSCEDGNYLYKGKCLSTCPNGTFKFINNLNQTI